MIQMEVKSFCHRCILPPSPYHPFVINVLTRLILAGFDKRTLIPWSNKFKLPTHTVTGLGLRSPHYARVKDREVLSMHMTGDSTPCLMNSCFYSTHAPPHRSDLQH
jgi:hypothetical protein